jgi:hypothetical protein
MTEPETPPFKSILAQRAVLHCHGVIIKKIENIINKKIKFF